VILPFVLIFGTWAVAVAIALAVGRREVPEWSEVPLMLSVNVIGVSGSIVAICIA